jgi:sirohydrochlorin cobaltochelatase
VNEANFADAVLVVLGHGTELNEQSAAPVRQHAAELRRRGIFHAVCEAFWKQPPTIHAVLAEISAPRVFIAPLFISEGYFAGQAIPEALGFHAARVLQESGRRLYYCKPVGTHPRMTEVILARAAAVVRQFPFPRAPKPAETTLFIAGHGTEKNRNSRVAIDQQVALIRARNLYAGVEAVFMEEEPRIGSVTAQAHTKACVVVPFFISDGLHVAEDIPVLLGDPAQAVKERLAAGLPGWRNPTEKQQKLIWYTPSVGTEPGLADVILEGVREAVGGKE